jgi:glucose-6-phosphate 1-dehydrogenase
MNPELLLREAWKRLVEAYASGRVILRTEKNMEKAMTQICESLIAEQGLVFKVKRQERHRERIVDLVIRIPSQHVLAQLKLYHDKADWKESPSMTNTVESDLKFAKGHLDTFVALIDTIPSTSRASLPFRLRWEEIEINEKVFNREYATIHPKTSPPRERHQKALLTIGTEI